MTTVYLAGAMTDAGPEGRAWRAKAAKLLAPYAVCLDPYKIEVGCGTPAKIVAADYQAILSSDYVLAYVGEPSWGTAMELMFAANMKIPVVCWGSKRESELSPWLRYCSLVFLGPLESGVQYILSRSWPR